jgi:hypothetical protein
MPIRWHWCIAIAAGLAAASPSFAQSPNQQAKCSSEAEQAFTTHGYVINGVTRVDPNGDTDVTAVYQSHYNPIASKCFLMLQTNGVGHLNLGVIDKILIDVTEDRVYAEYTWMPQGGKVVDIPPTDCELMPSLTEHKRCNSEAEFMAFVSHYME